MNALEVQREKKKWSNISIQSVDKMYTKGGKCGAHQKQGMAVCLLFT